MESQAVQFKPPTEPQPLERLSQLALRYVSAAVPVSKHQSFPFPAVKDGRLKVCFLYCSSGPSPKGKELLAPDYLETVDGLTARLDDFVTVTPQSLAVPRVAISQVIGYVPLPAGLTLDEYSERRSRMLGCMDRLVRAFFAGRKDLDEGERKAAAEFRSLWAVLSEAALAPYYESAGKPWFDWVRRVAP